jgi:predicted transcriptional regulator
VPLQVALLAQKWSSHLFVAVLSQSAPLQARLDSMKNNLDKAKKKIDEEHPAKLKDFEERLLVVKKKHEDFKEKWAEKMKNYDKLFKQKQEVRAHPWHHHCCLEMFTEREV